MANPLGKAKVAAALKHYDCKDVYAVWNRAAHLEEPVAIRLDSLADESEGIPRLRELGDYLLLDTGDGETVLIFHNNKGVRRELLNQLVPFVQTDSKAAPQRNVLIERQDRIEDYEDTEPDYKEGPDVEWTSDEYPDDALAPDEEPDYESHERHGGPRPGKRG